MGKRTRVLTFFTILTAACSTPTVPNPRMDAGRDTSTDTNMADLAMDITRDTPALDVQADAVDDTKVLDIEMDVTVDINSDEGIDSEPDSDEDTGDDTGEDTGEDAGEDTGEDAGSDEGTDTVEASVCLPNEMLCGSTCLDVQSDPDRCGNCDNVCPAPSTCRVRACVNASCSELPAPARSTCTLPGGGTGVCDLQASPACVECLSDTDCTSPQRPLCATTSNTCRARHLLLMASTGGSTPTVLGGSYTLGTWTTRTLPTNSTDATTRFGGGVVAVEGPRGVGLVRTGSGAPLEGSVWDGTWSNFAQALPTAGRIGDLVRVPGGAEVLTYSNTLGSINIARFDLATGVWTPNPVPAVASGVALCSPALSITSTGEELVIYQPGINQPNFKFTLFRAGAWTAPADIPGLTQPSFSIGPMPIRAIRRVNSDEIVVVVSSGDPATTLLGTVYSSNGWTTPITITSNARSVRPGTALTALNDGRVALVYIAQDNGVYLSFYQSGAWTTPRVILGVSVLGELPMAISQGVIPGITLDLVYGGTNLYHKQLIDEATWLWSTPVTIANGQYDGVTLVQTQ